MTTWKIELRSPQDRRWRNVIHNYTKYIGVGPSDRKTHYRRTWIMKTHCVYPNSEEYELTFDQSSSLNFAKLDCIGHVDPTIVNIAASSCQK